MIVREGSHDELLVELVVLHQENVEDALGKRPRPERFCGRGGAVKLRLGGQLKGEIPTGAMRNEDRKCG